MRCISSPSLACAMICYAFPLHCIAFPSRCVASLNRRYAWRFPAFPSLIFASPCFPLALHQATSICYAFPLLNFPLPSKPLASQRIATHRYTEALLCLSSLCLHAAEPCFAILRCAFPLPRFASLSPPFALLSFARPGFPLALPRCASPLLCLESRRLPLALLRFALPIPMRCISSPSLAYATICVAFPLRCLAELFPCFA
jgi:hypothetical protein